MDKIVAWSERKKLTLNVSKCEATFFSTDSHELEAKLEPELRLLGEKIKFNPSPKFLGVHLDRTLAFQKHTDYVADKVASRNRILASLSSKTWGWRKEKLTTVYKTMQRSVLDYAAPAWQPWLSKIKCPS